MRLTARIISPGGVPDKKTGTKIAPVLCQRDCLSRFGLNSTRAGGRQAYLYAPTPQKNPSLLVIT